MIWAKEPVATWYASVPLNSTGYIISDGSADTTAKLKTISTKGQNPNTTTEEGPDWDDNDYGHIGRIFADLFSISYFEDIKRKVEEVREVS